MEIVDKFYNDATTFVSIFNSETDNVGDSFNYEVECHTDEGDKWYAVKVYDHEILETDLVNLPNGMLEMAIEAKKALDNKC